MPLTDTWLKATHAKRSDKVREKADRDGMGVRVTPAGKVIFQMRYRYNGSRNARRLDLGTHPAVNRRFLSAV